MRRACDRAANLRLAACRIARLVIRRRERAQIGHHGEMMRLGFLRRQTELLHLCACTQPRCRHSLVVPHLLCTPTHTSKSTETVVLIRQSPYSHKQCALIPLRFRAPVDISSTRRPAPRATAGLAAPHVLRSPERRSGTSGAATVRCAKRSARAPAGRTKRLHLWYGGAARRSPRYCTATPCAVSQHVVLCSGTVLQHVVLCSGTVLQHVVLCSGTVLQHVVHCVAARCTLRCAAWAAWRTRWLRSSSA